MPDEVYPVPEVSPLAASAARATTYHRLGDSLSPQSLDEVVCTGEIMPSVPAYFLANDLVVVDFKSISALSGCGIPAHEVIDGVVPAEIREIRDRRQEVRSVRCNIMTAVLAAVAATRGTNDLLTEPVNLSNEMSAKLIDGKWSVYSPREIPPFPNKHSVIGISNLENAIRFLRKLNTEHPNVGFELISMLYRAAYQQQLFDYEGCLAHAWVVLEQAQNILWKEFIKTGYKTNNPYSHMNKDRRDNLLSDRNYTAAIKSQILAISGVYNDDLISKVDRVRRLRNAYMHNLRRLDSLQATEALHAAAMVSSKALGERFHIFAGQSWGDPHLMLQDR